MILRCSRGHKFDTSKAEALRRKKGFLQAGDKCPVEINYRLFKGATYCRRVLKVGTPGEVSSRMNGNQ